MASKNTRKVAPDGGYGWFATLGVSLINLATRGIEPSFGLLFGDILTDLNTGTAGAAIIISGLDVMMNMSGLFVGPLLKEFSYRKVAFIGALMCALGLMLTSFAESMVHIIATYSVINGIGVGLATSAAFVALNHYFLKKRGQAVGLSMAGTAVGMLIMPQLIRYLLEEYGFRGALLIIGVLALHAAVGAVLLQPVKWHLKDAPLDIELTDPVIVEFNTMNTIEETENDEDELPEINSLLFSNNKSVGRRLNESREHSPGIMVKRPTFPRTTSAINEYSSAAGATPGSHGRNGFLLKPPSFPRITSASSMSHAVRKRRESVVSSLSQFDFAGSGLHIHIDTGDKEAEEETQFLRRVSTHAGLSLNKNGSFAKLPPRITSGIELGKLEKEEPESPKKSSFFSRFVELLDVDLLHDKSYLNLLFGLSIFYVAEMNFKMVTPFFMTSLGFTKSDVALCLSISALTDILARVLVPPICDRLNITKRMIFMSSILLVAITRSIMAEQTTWTGVVTVISISGFFRGISLSNFTLTVSEAVPLERLPAAFGWHMIGKALFVIAFGPLIGAIRDWTDSFPICIHVQSLCIFMCIIAWVTEFLLQHFQRKN